MTKSGRTRLDRRNEFIETAMQVFGQKGAAHTSLRDVIKAMNKGKGVGMSVFYYYFRSKDDLVNACVNSYFNSYVQAVIAVLDNPSLDVQGALDGVTPHIIKAIQKMDAIFSDRTFRYDYLGSNLNLVDSFLSRIIAHLVQALDRWLKQGDLPRTRLTETAGTETIAWLISDGMSSVIIKRGNPDSHTDTPGSISFRLEETAAYLSQLLNLPLKAPTALSIGE